MLHYVRRATQQDVIEIMQIIDDAKELLKSNGNPQWQNGYPNKDTIKQDIANNNGYVLIVNQQVVGYAALIVGLELNYTEIQGSWRNNDDSYATIHRIAIKSNMHGKNLANLFIGNLITLTLAQNVNNIRIDTHRVNKAMQHLVGKYAFEYRGIINVADEVDSERLAYELNLKNNI